jgi:hypothetical protein
MQLILLDPIQFGGYSAVWLTLILVLPALGAWRIGKAILDPLRNIPGPFLARFTRLWYLKHVWGGKFEQANIELHKRFGECLMRLTSHNLTRYRTRRANCP